jgi:hypothetical protein
MRRAVALAALGTAAAVVLGSLAVSLAVSLADAAPGTRTAVAATAGAGDGPATVPAPSATGEHTTVGGTVFATCGSGDLEIGTAPASGWQLDDQDQHGEVEFESTTQRVEVHVACVDGVPVFRDQGVRADEPEDGSGGSADDSTGRVGGGHGSDDPPGDDNGGDRPDDRDDD